MTPCVIECSEPSAYGIVAVVVVPIIQPWQLCRVSSFLGLYLVRLGPSANWYQLWTTNQGN